ncbi:hypothetical protein PVK06_011100 [Gossypium arboreum]|uniref:Uncharacterized protein n=1 Tax=Gossypium arboreum TaxID=29729 RepID=A0ABR0Q8P3_GOSAR|nr:hypothetical protein PVK06_011100 [Gossypium arboreum]
MIQTNKAIIDLHRSSNIAKATEDKALVVARKWKASKNKAHEDAKFWQDKAKKYKTKRDTTQVALKLEQRVHTLTKSQLGRRLLRPLI